MSSRRRSATIADFVERAYVVLGEIDYYRILGVGRDAEPDAVRAAYYKLATSLHPDVHGADIDTAFKQKLTSVYSRLVEAYRVLSDVAQRRDYDSGLAGGELRQNTGIKVKVRPEDGIEDAGARKFYLLGMQGLGSRDARSAVMNLRLALSLEDNAIVRDALAQAEALLKEPGG